MNIAIQKSPVSVEMLGQLLDNIENGKISNRTAKEVFEEMVESGKSASDIIEDKGMSQISDENRN